VAEVRLFVAVELDDAVRREMASLTRDLGRRIADLGVAGLRWVAPENLHLTLRFIGEVDTDRAARVIRALSPPLPLSPFDVRFDHLGVFPSRGAPRVLWVGVASGREALGRVFDAIEERVRAAGLTPEPRPFAAHLTLARFRERVFPPRGAGLQSLLGVHPDLPVLAVTGTTLFESRLTPTGPRYEARLKTALSGS
jgi:2'-5' RNA ligase